MMRGSICRRSPSEGEDNNLVIVSVKPSLSDSDGPPPSEENKNNDVHVPVPVQDHVPVHVQEDFNAKGPKEESFPVSSDLSKKRRNRKRQRERVGSSAKKWSSDEEISLSMALLECRRLPDGRINRETFYQRAKESLHDEVSDFQLHDKLKNMKVKFKAIQAKLKEHRTHHESALLKNLKRVWGNNGYNQGNYSENPKENGVLYLTEFENPRENVVESLEEIRNENPRGNEGQIRNGNSMEIEAVNPAEAPRERGAESPVVNDNPRGIDGENSGDIGSETPAKIEVTKPRGSGIEKEKDGEEQNLQNSVSHETLNIEDNRVCKLQKCKSGHFGDNIKTLLERTESRLQASIESSINRVAVASAAGAIFRPFGGFGPETEMEVFLSRKMKELMDGFTSVKEFPGLDAVQSRDLQQRWRALKIQEVRMFSESLDLLQKQCSLFLKNAESSVSTNNHGSEEFQR